MLLRVVIPPAECTIFLLLVELWAVPVSLTFYLVFVSGVSLLLICLLLLHWVSTAEDFVVEEVVKAVVAVLSKLVLGHLFPVLNVLLYW